MNYTNTGHTLTHWQSSEKNGGGVPGVPLLPTVTGYATYYIIGKYSANYLYSHCNLGCIRSLEAPIIDGSDPRDMYTCFPIYELPFLENFAGIDKRCIGALSGIYTRIVSRTNYWASMPFYNLAEKIYSITGGTGLTYTVKPQRYTENYTPWVQPTPLPTSWDYKGAGPSGWDSFNILNGSRVIQPVGVGNTYIGALPQYVQCTTWTPGTTNVGGFVPFGVTDVYKKGVKIVDAPRKRALYEWVYSIQRMKEYIATFYTYGLTLVYLAIDENTTFEPTSSVDDDGNAVFYVRTNSVDLNLWGR